MTPTIVPVGTSIPPGYKIISQDETTIAVLPVDSKILPDDNNDLLNYFKGHKGRPGQKGGSSPGSGGSGNGGKNHDTGLPPGQQPYPAQTTPITPEPDKQTPKARPGSVTSQKQTAARPEDEKTVGIGLEIAPNPDEPDRVLSWNKLSPEEKRQATDEIGDKVISAALKKMGLKGATILKTTGGFESGLNPSLDIRFKPGTDLSKVREAGKTLGAAMHQKAVVVYDQNKEGDENAPKWVELKFDRGLHDDEVKDLYTHIVHNYKPAGDLMHHRPGSMQFGNFGATDMDTFTKHITQAAQEHATSKGYKVLPQPTTSHYHSELVETAANGSKTAPDALSTAFDREFGRHTARHLRNTFIGHSGRSGQRGGSSPRGSYIPLIHFSHHPHSEIDPQFQGQGLPGAEAVRRQSYPELYQPRTYWYTRGYQKEGGLGGVKNVIKVPRHALYDFDNDPQDFIGRAQNHISKTGRYGQFDNPAITSQAEAMIKDAGYLGYISPGYNAAVLFHKVPASGKVDWDKVKNSVAGLFSDQSSIRLVSRLNARQDHIGAYTKLVNSVRGDAHTTDTVVPIGGLLKLFNAFPGHLGRPGFIGGSKPGTTGAAHSVTPYPAQTTPLAMTHQPVKVFHKSDPRYQSAHAAYVRLLERAKANLDGYKHTMFLFAKHQHVKFKLAKIKSEARTTSKIVAEYGGHPERIKDMLRGTFEVHDRKAADKLAHVFESKFRVNPKSKRNLWSENAKLQEGTGYRDAKFNVKIGHGFPVEVQISTTAMLAAKHKAHPYMKEAQELERNAVTELRDLTPEERKKIDVLKKKQYEIYSKVKD